ncbi:hypothetical protein [Zavarzinella formosa]|uniref:hypothetical protein n=1 Tax=Zavarzinella formosa TaxID=360055 RepID=UPI000302E514|nr:hypothetical protein [Zavarzinella formosa]
MAIDYTDLFTRGGKLVKYVNSRLPVAATSLPAELTAIANLFEAADLTEQITRLYDDYAGFQSNITRERQTLAGYWDAILTDRDTVLTELRVPDADVNSVLPELFRRMVADSQTVDQSTVTIGSVTADAENEGNGTVLLTKLLDGYNPPIQGGLPTLQYAGLNSELAVPSETMTFTCTADSARDGLPEGSERFSWSGGIAGQKFDFEAEGSGDGPGLTAAGDSQLINNGNFEQWSSNTPSGWTVAAGTAGTHIKQMTTAANVYRGDSSLWFDGDGTQATIQINQSVSSGRMQSRRLYCVSVRVKASAASGTGAFLCQFTGTGYTASSTEKIAITAGSMPTAWTLYNFWIVTPAVMPDDWTLTVANTGTPGASSNVYVDCLIPTEGTYHGGIAAVLLPGAAPYAAGDRFTVAISNDQAGTFQDFFRQCYGVQLPSNGAGAETISDSLAT